MPDKKPLLLSPEEYQTWATLESQIAIDEAIIRSVGEGLLVADQLHRVIKINNAAAKMLGWEDWNAIGRQVNDVAPVELEKGDTSILDVPSSHPGQQTFFLVRKDKTRFPAAITTSSTILGREIIGSVIVFRDITLEKQIEQSKSDFVAISSHQLRTPLGSIKWTLEMLLAGDFGPVSDQVKKVIHEVLENNERLIGLIGDLLNVSRIDTGRVVAAPQSTDVVPIINKAVSQAKPDAKKKDIAININIEGDIRPVYLDPKRFWEVFQNLLTNAIKYNIPGGKIAIHLFLKGEKVQLDLTDTGIGIPASSFGRLFSRFYRADNAFKSDTEGTGLGLFVVKSYVEDWGGRIWFESEINKGTAFHFDMPVVK